MDGKSPISVITDSDLAMKNAIATVFPKAHHRLCAWYLLRNATSNIANPLFTSQFKKLILGDYEVGAFHKKWEEMVKEFGIEDKLGVRETYEKRHSWATTLIREKFFGGFRITSRCENLHSIISKYVTSRFTLSEFVHHFHCCVEHTHFREHQADFKSIKGIPVMQTTFEPLKKYATEVFSLEVFLLFKPLLQRATSMMVVSIKETPSCTICVVARYLNLQCCQKILFSDDPLVFKCLCMRMESLGIPCEHIVRVLVHHHIPKLPESLVLRRWRKDTKEGMYNSFSTDWDSLRVSLHGCLMDWFRVVSARGIENDIRFVVARDWAIEILKAWNAEYAGGDATTATNTISNIHGSISGAPPGDPPVCKIKGRSSHKSRSGLQRCTIGKGLKHNKTTCPKRKEL